MLSLKEMEKEASKEPVNLIEWKKKHPNFYAIAKKTDRKDEVIILCSSNKPLRFADYDDSIDRDKLVFVEVENN